MVLKRDLASLRYILRRIEEHVDPHKGLRLDAVEADYVEALGSTQEALHEFRFAIELLKEEKFILVRTVQVNANNGANTWTVLDRITWRGYNLMDAIDQERPLDSI